MLNETHLMQFNSAGPFTGTSHFIFRWLRRCVGDGPRLAVRPRIQMLDGVRTGDTVEQSLLLAFTAGGSSFSHIVLISVLWLRCGCVKVAMGGGFQRCPWLSSALSTPCNQRSYLCHLARSASPSSTSPLSPFP